MISLEDLSDFRAIGLDKQIGLNKQDYEDWIKQIFKDHDICELDQKQLSVLLTNLRQCYMGNQEKGAKVDNDKIKLLRLMSIYELVYNYKYTCQFRKFIDVQSFSTPAGLVWHAGGSVAVPVKTRKSNGVEELFIDIQNEIIEILYKNIDEPEDISIEGLRPYLEKQDYNKIVYDSSIELDSDSFKPMVSNACVVRIFEDFDKELIEVEGCIKKDEILLKKQDSLIDIGICFCPYLIPMRVATQSSLKPGVMGRYGLWVSDDLNKHFKRVKVVK